MNIGIFSSFKYDTAAQKVQSAVRALNHPVTIYYPEQRWVEGDRDAILRDLEPHTHFILVTDDSLPHELWSVLVHGYALGRRAGCACFVPDDPTAIVESEDLVVDLPLVPAHRHRSIEDLLFWLREEAVRWTSEDARRRSRQTIEHAGLAVTPQAFLSSCEVGDPNLVEAFLHLEFHPAITNERGLNALHLAVRAGRLEVVRLLLTAGADPNSASPDRGDNALGEAVTVGHLGVVREVLRTPVAVNHRNHAGQTALSLAVGRNDEPMVVELLAHGADPSITDAMGMSATQYARLFRRDNLITLLES